MTSPAASAPRVPYELFSSLSIEVPAEQTYPIVTISTGDSPREAAVTEVARRSLRCRKVMENLMLLSFLAVVILFPVIDQTSGTTNQVLSAVQLTLFISMCCLASLQRR